MTVTPSSPDHRMDDASPWIVRWAGLVRPGGSVLDLACGAGRHSRWFARRGHPVTAADRDRTIADWASRETGVVSVVADLEGGPWPFTGRQFDAVVVTNYLHRPLFTAILDSIAPGGVLMYETFAVGNERFGKPSNPAFLLRHGELLEVVQGQLRIVAYEDVELAGPRPAMVQRIVAMRD